MKDAIEWAIQIDITEALEMHVAPKFCRCENALNKISFVNHLRYVGPILKSEVHASEWFVEKRNEILNAKNSKWFGVQSIQVYQIFNLLFVKIEMQDFILKLVWCGMETVRNAMVCCKCRTNADRLDVDIGKMKSELKYNHRSEMITRGTPATAMHTKCYGSHAMEWIQDKNKKWIRSQHQIEWE